MTDGEVDGSRASGVLVTSSGDPGRVGYATASQATFGSLNRANERVVDEVSTTRTDDAADLLDVRRRRMEATAFFSTSFFSFLRGCVNETATRSRNHRI
ncbi:hypothetical protein Zmor_024105 [Zophobas morio]|uniref:Uncharacterized protein n=1 Tax=Zophobas morio TaxID=2755281 RepID=A0AA38M766_9CUCU|nr:hypothetical protein Zmor_024105 [Zophobas morio]